MHDLGGFNEMRVFRLSSNDYTDIKGVNIVFYEPTANSNAESTMGAMAVDNHILMGCVFNDEQNFIAST